jgi:hypothetical protein
VTVNVTTRQWAIGSLMTDKQATHEAIIRWGKYGMALRRHSRPIENGLSPYAVGKGNENVFETLGHGETWEEAFQDAADFRDE